MAGVVLLVLVSLLLVTKCMAYFFSPLKKKRPPGLLSSHVPEQIKTLTSFWGHHGWLGMQPTYAPLPMSNVVALPQPPTPHPKRYLPKINFACRMIRKPISRYLPPARGRACRCRRFRENSYLEL